MSANAGRLFVFGGPGAEPLVDGGARRLGGEAAGGPGAKPPESQVHAYGTVIGTGNAIVEWDPRRAARPAGAAR